MPVTINSQNDTKLNNSLESKSALVTEPVDTQVKARKQYSQRRKLDTAYKLRIIAAYDACENSLMRGALLRKEGLYHSSIYAWKKQFEKAKSSDHAKQSSAIRSDHLKREIEQLRKQLAQAEAIIDLQKKVSDLFTTHILAHENSDVKS